MFLLYFTPHHFNQQNARVSSSAKRIEKMKQAINKIQELLSVELGLKAKWCRELQGFFSEEGKFFDDLLIETLHSLLKDCKDEEVLTLSRIVVEDALLLPLSEGSLSLCLEIM